MVLGIGGPAKSSGLKLKLILALVAIVGILSVYSYFAYQREIFPFTKENKAKIQKLIKGKEGKSADEEEEEELNRQLQEELAAGGGDEEGLGGVDEFGSLTQPRGGTGERVLDEAGRLKDPTIKGDEQMTQTYQQEMFRQLFLPYETDPLYGAQTGAGNLTPSYMPIARGGDIPRPGENVGSMPSPLQYPFPIDERMYQQFGLYPPGGTYRNELGDYPYYYGNRARKAMKSTITNRVAYLGNSITPSQKQFAFSKLQNRARKMNRLNDPPVIRKGNLAGNVLPPVVAKRHLGTSLGIS